MDVTPANIYAVHIYRHTKYIYRHACIHTYVYKYIHTYTCNVYTYVCIVSTHFTTSMCAWLIHGHFYKPELAWYKCLDLLITFHDETDTRELTWSVAYYSLLHTAQ